VDKFNFNKLVENPFLVKSEHVKSLQKVVELYPYCQPARILLTKAMQLAGNLNYEKTLNQTSAGMGERQLLKYWITATDKPELALTETFTGTAFQSPLLVPDPIRSYRGPDKAPPIDDLFKSVEENLSTLRQTRNKAAGLDTEADIISVPQVNIFEKILPFEQIPPRKNNEEKTPNIKRLSKELPQGLINDFVNTEHTSRDFLSNPFKPAMENTEFFDYKEYKEHQKTAHNSNNKDQEKIDAIAKNFPYSSALPSSAIESSTMGESISEQSDADMLLNYLEHAKKKKRNPVLSKEKVNSILTRFIQDEPSVRPASKDTENLSDEDLSQKSSRLQSIPASENFAELLVLQGKFAKAIDVFGELVLKYPEKKPYFVTQIEELKNKLYL